MHSTHSGCAIHKDTGLHVVIVMPVRRVFNFITTDLTCAYPCNELTHTDLATTVFVVDLITFANCSIKLGLFLAVFAIANDAVQQQCHMLRPQVLYVIIDNGNGAQRRAHT
jgi:hypothetical protein